MLLISLYAYMINFVLPYIHDPLLECVTTLVSSDDFI